MVQHQPIQDPKKYSEKDYQKFEYLLLSENTDQEELEKIVMLLAHIPTKRAQDILKKFKNSERAEEVQWRDVAMDEGEAWYIWPNTDQEEKDMMALKLFHERNDRIVDLMGQEDGCKFRIKQYEIELAALRELQKEKLNKDEQEDLKHRMIALNELINMEKNKLDDLIKEISFEEKLNKKIKESIKTERYKNLEPWDISGFHFDGEGM